MTAQITAIVEKISGVLREHEKATTAMWLRVGGLILSVKEHLPAGLDARGRDKRTVREASRVVSGALERMGVKGRSPASLYNAARAAEVLGEAQKAILLSAAVPMRDVSMLVSKRYTEASRAVAIDKIKAGGRTPNMARRVYGKSKHHEHDGHSLNVTIPVHGDIEDTLDPLRSLMSQWGPSKFAAIYNKAATMLAKNGQEWPRMGE